MSRNWKCNYGRYWKYASKVYVSQIVIAQTRKILNQNYTAKLKSLKWSKVLYLKVTICIIHLCFCVFFRWCPMWPLFSTSSMPYSLPFDGRGPKKVTNSRGKQQNKTKTANHITFTSTLSFFRKIIFTFMLLFMHF